MSQHAPVRTTRLAENEPWDPESIPSLARELRRAWLCNDAGAVDEAVAALAAARDVLVRDWMPVMIAYHLPDWRPMCPTFPFRPFDPKTLVAQLDIATFALFTPLAELLQMALQRKCSIGPYAMLTSVNGKMVASEALASELEQCADFRGQLDCLGRWFLRCSEIARDEAVALVGSSEHLRTLVAECATYRFLTAAIVKNDPSLHFRPHAGPGVLAEQLSSAAISGSSIIYRLADVLCAVAGAYGLAIDDGVVARNMIETKLLVAMARLEIGDSEALSRIISGCEESCYSLDDGIVERSSPHRDYLQLFGDVTDFRKRHWRYMWFEPTRFAMFGDTTETARLGINFSLGSSLDPMSGRSVASALPRHPRMGCPALLYKGVQDLANIVVAVLEHPVVVKRMNEASQQRQVSMPTTLLPAELLVRQFDVLHEAFDNES